jgi:hypothetical protein
MGSFYSCRQDPGAILSRATIDFYLTDAPCDYDHVWIDIQGLEIHSDSNGWESVEPFNSGVYDLLELSNGLDTFLGTIDLPVGKVSQIRLILGDGNSLEIDGNSHDLKVPSGSQSGLKLNLHMDLQANTSYVVWLDFDACKSVVQKGNGEYSLKPVIRAFSDSTNGKLKGYVMPLSAGATVHAIDNGDTFRALPDTNGYWMITGLDGTYDVWVLPDTSSGLSDTLIPGVNVPFGAIVDMDTIQLN